MKNSNINYKDLSIQCDSFFTQEHYCGSSNPLRKVYRFQISELDFWINIQYLDISNAFTNDGQRFKNALFYHLKKLGWKSTHIKGRWKKEIYN